MEVAIFVLALITIFSTGSLGQKRGKLIFSEDFDGDVLGTNFWDSDDSCKGRGDGDVNMECFKAFDPWTLVQNENIDVKGGSLVIKAMPELWQHKRFTSARIRLKKPNIRYGSIVVRARMARGQQLLSNIWLRAPNASDCIYEEVNIAKLRGQRPATLIFSAYHGRNFYSASSRASEKVFPRTDFTNDFHEFGLEWRSTKLIWYVDGRQVHEMNTHFISDWTKPNSEPPCESEREIGPFNRHFELVVSLEVGGRAFPPAKYGTLTPEDADTWTKPTLEIDWVKIFEKP